MDIETREESEDVPTQDEQSESQDTVPQQGMQEQGLQAQEGTPAQATPAQATPADESPTLPEQIELAVNGEKRQYSVDDLQKLASAGVGFNDLNQEKQQWEYEKQQWEQEKEDLIAQAQQQASQELKQQYTEKLPELLKQSYERQRKLESMDDVERQIFTQNEQIALLKREQAQTRQLMEQKEAEMQQQQQQHLLEYARQHYQAFFEKQGVDNDYIKNSFLTAVSQLQDQGITDFDMQELLKTVKDNYNETLTGDLTAREPQDLIGMLGEEKLAEIQNYLVSQRQNKGKTTAASPAQADADEDQTGNNFMSELYV